MAILKGILKNNSGNKKTSAQKRPVENFKTMISNISSLGTWSLSKFEARLLNEK